MSATRFMLAHRLQPTDAIPHMTPLSHPEFISDVAGIDYYAHPLQAAKRFYARFDLDMGGPRPLDDTPIARPKPQITKDGTTVTDEAFHTGWNTMSPFTEPEDLWNFDPDPWGKDADKAIEPGFATKNYRWVFEPQTWPERRKREAEQAARVKAVWPHRFPCGQGFYCTTFMYGICIFGWDVFLMALGLDRDRTGAALQRISEITVRMFQYFASCDHVEFIHTHDDLAMTSGPVAAPAWYRRWIYPQYERIFAPVKAAGKPVLLTSDGNVTALAPDVMPVVDGLIFESSTPPDYLFDAFGKTKCLIGGVSGKILTFGTPASVTEHVTRIMEMGRPYPGFIVGCGDCIPANVPIPNVYAYFETIEKLRRR